MTATYMHIGIPITEKKPNMTYNEDMKFWVSNVDDYDYKVEYLKFEEGTPFPEELHRRWHVAYAVDDLDHYADDADRVICGPMDAGPGVRLAFVEKDGAVIELYEDKNYGPHGNGDRGRARRREIPTGSRLPARVVPRCVLIYRKTFDQPLARNGNRARISRLFTQARESPPPDSALRLLMGRSNTKSLRDNLSLRTRGRGCGFFVRGGKPRGKGR